MGLLARSLVVLAAFAAGSWVGLHSSSAAAPAPALAAAPPPVAAPSAPVATNTPDPLADAPEINAFPHLNPEASITKAWRLAQGPHRAPGDNRKILTPRLPPRGVRLSGYPDVAPARDGSIGWPEWASRR